MNERVAVQHFQRTGIIQRVGGIGTAKLAGSQRQHGANPLAAAQQAVAGSLAQFRLLRQVSITQLRQVLLGQLRPGGKLLFVILSLHRVPPRSGPG